MKIGPIITGICFILCAITFSAMIYNRLQYKNIYQKKYFNEWALADRSSTISAKLQHLTKFYNSLEGNREEFSDYGALFYKDPSNSFDANLAALKTLIDRLDKIKDMDENTMAYQIAIQQITAQEQGEAKEMLSVFVGSWLIESHPIFYIFNNPLIIAFLGIGTFVFVIITIELISI